ncbi:hypothetical protein HDU97_003890 [Phlyctochytrium planicorne]|nr:hypothetical protein HDU97_003890 [Phlyctochytrium planicorne]
MVVKLADFGLEDGFGATSTLLAAKNSPGRRGDFLATLDSDLAELIVSVPRLTSTDFALRLASESDPVESFSSNCVETIELKSPL